MDRYFKILCVREEIQRLNIEIRRVVTWIRDENRFLRKMEKNLREMEGKLEEQIAEDAGMAVQVRLYRERRGRFDAGHLDNFYKLAREPGFTGTLQCGVSVERREAQQRLRELRAELAGEDEEEMEVDDEEVVEAAGGVETNAGESDEEDEGHEAREEAVSGLLYQISMFAVDDGERGVADDD